MAEKEQRIIRTVIQNKSNLQKSVTIPKNCHIQVGDQVELITVPPPSEWKKK